MKQLSVFIAATAMLALPACSPTVRVEASDKPIVINMNIKIDHEIRVKLDKDIDTMLDNRKDIF